MIGLGSDKNCTFLTEWLPLRSGDDDDDDDDLSWCWSNMVDHVR